MYRKICVLALLTSSLFALNVGESYNEVVLDGKNGGLVDGEAWHSSMLKDKVYVLFYVDPDEKDTNNDFVEALHAKGYDRKNYGSVAIINLAATWKPNMIIEALLKAKQKKFPHTIYVKDKSKVLVKNWNLKDDSSDVVIFDKSGNAIYTYEGKMDSVEIDKALSLIEKNL
jgi:YtfJ family uncharacterized protein